jgi:hypothetical protein
VVVLVHVVLVHAVQLVLLEPALMWVMVAAEGLHRQVV